MTAPSPAWPRERFSRLDLARGIGEDEFDWAEREVTQLLDEVPPHQRLPIRFIERCEG